MARSGLCCVMVAIALAFGAAAQAQTTPLAAIAGRVTGPSGVPLGGVEVSVSSPALQGVRGSTTAAGGDFLIPFLPAGRYEIVFRREGFVEARTERHLRTTETARIDVGLQLAGTAESITVSAEPASVIGQSSAVAATYPASLLDRLPVDRSLRGAMLLAPGVAATEPAGYPIIAGAMPYENLYRVNGVEVREIVFGQPRPFPIEDAVEETSTAVTGVSAEYGRFIGGVVNVVTRSGGNELAGSLRVTLENEAWRSLSPYERETLAADPRVEAVVPTYEATLGGPVLRDRLWYFLAGRSHDRTSAETLAYSDLPYRYRTREMRLEAKVTTSPCVGQDLRIAYGEIDTREENRVFPPAMDYRSLLSFTTPEDLLSVHHAAVAARNLFVEGQYARRRSAPTGVGARGTDLVAGTLLRDASRNGATWNSPLFCGVCGVAPGELRRAEEENRDLAAKASGLFSAPHAGTHHLVVGGEIADELRRSNSFQSGSGFVVTASGAWLEDGAIRPLFLPGGSTVIEWRPIFHLSRGSRFRTTSAFVNDSLELGERFSVNLGLRWDAARARDQSGVEVSGSDASSPRLAAAWDPRGDGVWRLDAGFARYVAAVNFHLGDIGTTHGRPARFAYTYYGPAINADPLTELVSAEEALAMLFDWFFANGGTARPLRQAPAIPGLNRRVGGDLAPPRSDETTLGVSRRIGARGFVRLGGVRREFTHQYSERADSSTGRVLDPSSGRLFDLRLVTNSDRVRRTYDALLTQLDLRIGSRLRLGGGYALSRTRGNFDSDFALPETDLHFFPEYGEERWRAPFGPLESDQRHRLRLWATYEPELGERRGRLALAPLVRLDSGGAWGAIGEIDSRPYVENPGYVAPPARVPYYFEDRGARRSETAVATDLAIHYVIAPRRLGRTELFTRIVVTNLFDQSAQLRPGNTAVLTAATDDRFEPFDPFVEDPVRGVHWDLAPAFGTALSHTDFAPPRTLSLALGARF